ncbi:MAG: formylglycine-generating enzyme family protein [Candidatus Sericytochromatia bacterium]|nr:formylglycine-generating enzyme family protein [Candidatus Sericytochromatia bacterium]
MDLTWDWLPAGVATDAIEVAPGATFSVAFKSYPGGSRYSLELLGVNGQVLASQEGTGSPLVATAVSGVSRYKLSVTQGSADGFAGATVAYPSVVWNSPEFVSLDPGSFVMGETGWTNATQSVTFTRGFDIQKTHVTQGQWQALMGSNPSRLQGCDDCPVESVSWFDAIAFANALSRLKGLPEVYNADGSLKSGSDIYATTGYRLPTEAEWEYAYRAGTTTVWYNGDDESKVGDIAWFSGNSGGRTQPVAQKLPNGFGLFDMAGNVWQWTNDWYADYPGGAVTDPAGPQSSSSRVFRGGARNFDASATRAAYRINRYPDSRNYYIGFRLARSRPSAEGCPLTLEPLVPWRSARDLVPEPCLPARAGLRARNLEQGVVSGRWGEA